MSEQPPTFLTDPEIARRIRQSAADAAAELRRMSSALEGLEAGLRVLADEIDPGGSFDGDETKGAGGLVSDQGRLS